MRKDRLCCCLKPSKNHKNTAEKSHQTQQENDQVCCWDMSVSFQPISKIPIGKLKPIKLSLTSPNVKGQLQVEGVQRESSD